MQRFIILLLLCGVEAILCAQNKFEKKLISRSHIIHWKNNVRPSPKSAQNKMILFRTQIMFVLYEPNYIKHKSCIVRKEIIKKGK